MGKGFLAGIKLGLKLKFGDEGLKLLPEINEIKDVELLQTIHGAIETANTLDDLRQKYQ
jgi:hypothetical protein